MSTEHNEPMTHYGDDGHSASSAPQTTQSEKFNSGPTTQVSGGYDTGANDPGSHDPGSHDPGSHDPGGHDLGGSDLGSGDSGAGGPGSSGRRRRRRRKGKGPGGAANAAAGPGQPSQQAGEEYQVASIPAPPPITPQQPAFASAPPQNNGSQNNGQTFSQNSGGGKRKNRKRPGGGGGGAPQPGSAASGGAYAGKNRQNGFQGGFQGAPQNSGQNGSQSRPQNGFWRQRSNDGPDGNREGARGGFGSDNFSGNAGNGKGKFGRRGPTSFVGPMDHSYRQVNGNIADGSPSTMDFRNSNGNINGNVSGRNDYTPYEQPATVLDDAPARIICFIEDLFVVAKMQETARKLGVKVQFAKAEKETLAAITDAPEAERPSLIVFDLNNANAKPLTAIPKLKAKLKRSTSIIGFLQQIQGDLKLKATEAGCDSVMPKAAFSQNLPNLLRRHGLAEEEEFAGA